MEEVEAIGRSEPWSDRDAQVEAWRAIVAVLSGEPVPSVAPDAAQPTIEALAREAALSIACRFQQLAQPILAGLVRSYAERVLADLFDTDLASVPDDPPGPLDEPG